MRSPSVGRICCGTGGSDGVLGSVATGGEESDRSALECGGLDGSEI